MLVELTKRDLVNMIKGTQPGYDLFEHPLIKPFGYYNDNRGWYWDSSQLITEEEETLLMMYQLLKNQK